MTGVDPLIGRTLDGRYTIVGEIGRGTMGNVYRATQQGLGREVAVKVMTPTLMSDEVIIKRFTREAKLAGQLNHPNAVAVFDFGQTNGGLFYLAMELVRGRTLDAVVAESGKLSPARVVRIGTQICNALESAHTLQIIHRDLKPANIMLVTDNDDMVKVLDFGLAKSLRATDGTMTNVTSGGALLGTPAFMPPEIASDGVVDGRADLYSLGCILFFAATAKLPFNASTVTEMIALHALEPVPPLVGVPVGLARVVERLLAKDPRARYQDAASTRAALEEALATSSAQSGTMLGWATPARGAPQVKPPVLPAVAPQVPSAPVASKPAAHAPARAPVRDKRGSARSVLLWLAVAVFGAAAGVGAYVLAG